MLSTTIRQSRVSFVEISRKSLRRYQWNVYRKSSRQVENGLIFLPLRIQRSFIQSFELAKKSPGLTAIQTIGASVVLYSYSETDVALLRVWAVTGLMCYSVLPNVWRGQAILATWGVVFVMINGVRLYELMAQRAPVQLNADELIGYSSSGFHKFIPPQAFKRLAATSKAYDAPAGMVLKQESCEFNELILVLSGSVILSTYGKQVGKAISSGGIIGVPPASVDLNKNAAHYKVKATAGPEGARLLVWPVAELMQAVKAELDPSTEVQLIRFFSEKLLRELETRDHIALLKSYDRMVALAIRDAENLNNGIIQSDHKAALLEFRRINGVAQEEHVAALQKFNWSLEEWQIGIKTQPERTKAALLSLSKRIKIASSPASASNNGHTTKNTQNNTHFISDTAKLSQPKKQKPPPPFVHTTNEKKEEPPFKKVHTSSVQTTKQTTTHHTKDSSVPRRTSVLHSASSRMTWTRSDSISNGIGGLDEAARRIALLHRRRHQKTPEPAQVSPRVTSTRKAAAGKHKQNLLSIFEPPPQATSEIDESSPGRLHAPLRAIEPNVVARLSSKPSAPGFQELLDSSLPKTQTPNGTSRKLYPEDEQSYHDPNFFKRLASVDSSISSSLSWQKDAPHRNGTVTRSYVLLETSRKQSPSFLESSSSLKTGAILKKSTGRIGRLNPSLPSASLLRRSRTL